MDSTISVKAQLSISRSSIAHRLRLFAVIASAAVATACGGGGGGDGNGNGGTPTGQIAASVEDQFGAPVAGVTITATINDTPHTATTGNDGTATVTQVPTGSVTVTASADDVVEPPPQTVELAEDETENVAFTIQRVTEATGGISRAVRDPNTPLDPEGDSFTFLLRVIVIDQDFNPVTGLQDTAFTLRDCAEEVEDPPPQRPNCVRDDVADVDDPYTVESDTPASFDEIGQGDLPAPVPYAAGLLFDSSLSIATSDPTDARIFATKEYLSDVDSGDLVMLAAFADDNALLPLEPLTFYPCESATPCTPAFTSAGNSLFASLDELATLEKGGTPLYESLVTIDEQTDMVIGGMIVSVHDEAPTTPATLRKAVVLFSDGKDFYCSFTLCKQRRDRVVAEAESREVDIFTIGLSENVDSLAMAELALRNGGAYMFAERPTQLIPIFGVLDRLLADNMPYYEMVWTVNAASGVFSSGRAVLGRLTVDTGSGEPFTLPFTVQIP
jgi:hypothetical protein